MMYEKYGETEKYKFLALVLQKLTSTIVVIYILGLVSKPRRKGWGTKAFLSAHFVSFTWVVIIALAIEDRGSHRNVIFGIGLLVMLTVLFSFSLRLRVDIGQRSDQDLKAFLVNVVFEGGFKTLFSSLFVEFRTLKCIVEEVRDPNRSCINERHWRIDNSY